MANRLKEGARLTLRIPGPLHEALHIASFETRKSKNRLILEAIEQHPDIVRALEKMRQG